MRSTDAYSNAGDGLSSANLSNTLESKHFNKDTQHQKNWNKSTLVLPSTQLPSLVGYTDSIIKSNDMNTFGDTMNAKTPKVVHPLTPINEAYLEFYRNDRNRFRSSRNLNEEFVGKHQTVEDHHLNCDEELEIEQAREEIASMESEQAEVSLRNVANGVPFDYNKIKPKLNKNATKLSQQQYYNDIDNDLKFEETWLKSLYNPQAVYWDESLTDSKPVHHVSQADDESDGEPIIEYVNNTQSILNQYNPYTRTFFKWSIYSPSNRLYTVDEVNSTVSDPEMSSHLKFSNKNQDATNMTNSILISFTPPPKVSKVSSSRRIKTKTDKHDQRLNMTLFGPYQNLNSAKFLFKTVSSFPSNKSRDLGSPAIPLNSIAIRDKNSEREVMLHKSMRNLNSDLLYVKTKSNDSKVIKLSAEK